MSKTLALQDVCDDASDDWLNFFRRMMLFCNVVLWKRDEVTRRCLVKMRRLMCVKLIPRVMGPKTPRLRYPSVDVATLLSEKKDAINNPTCYPNKARKSKGPDSRSVVQHLFRQVMVTKGNPDYVFTPKTNHQIRSLSVTKTSITKHENTYVFRMSFFHNFPSKIYPICVFFRDQFYGLFSVFWHGGCSGRRLAVLPDTVTGLAPFYGSSGFR